MEPTPSTLRAAFPTRTHTMAHAALTFTQQDSLDGNGTLHVHAQQDTPGGPILLRAVDAAGRVVGSVAWDLFAGHVQLVVYDSRDDDAVLHVRMREVTIDEHADGVSPDATYRVAEVEIDEASVVAFTDGVVQSTSATSPWIEGRDGQAE